MLSKRPGEFWKTWTSGHDTVNNTGIRMSRLSALSLQYDLDAQPHAFESFTYFRFEVTQTIGWVSWNWKIEFVSLCLEQNMDFMFSVSLSNIRCTILRLPFPVHQKGHPPMTLAISAKCQLAQQRMEMLVPFANANFIFEGTTETSCLTFDVTHCNWRKSVEVLRHDEFEVRWPFSHCNCKGKLTW